MASRYTVIRGSRGQVVGISDSVRKMSFPVIKDPGRGAGGTSSRIISARNLAKERARKLAEERAQLEKIRKAQEEARRKAQEEARRKAQEKAQEEARRRKLSFKERIKLESEALSEIITTKKREEEIEKRLAKERLEKFKRQISPIAKNLFVEQKIVKTITRKGREIPVMKTSIVDEKGKIIRTATRGETSIIRKAQAATPRRIKLPIRKPVVEKIPILPQPFFVERQVDTFVRKGKVIPIIETFYVDPIKKTERKATASEQKFFRETRLTVTIPEIPKERLAIALAEAKKQEGILITQKQRGKSTVGTELKLAGLAVASTLVSTVQAIQQLPKLPKAIGVGIGKLIKEPGNIKSIPEAIKREGAEFGELLRVSPTTALAKIGTEVVILKGTGKVLKATGSLTSKAAARVSPKFRGVTKQVINVPSTQVGKTINIEIGGTLKTLKEPLKVQARLAGKEVTAVSAQADRLVRLLKTKRVVRKPIPGEEKLSIKTKGLLKKFDEGKIAKKDLIKLDKSIRKETGRAGSLLERSFFADPRGRLRPSRLGVEQKEASLLDVLAGDVTFKTQKPQVLIFEKAKVEKFPKALKGIEKKLKAGKTLTREEANKLLQFQLKKSSKFKPVGAISKEPEITLAPGEIVKKEKTIAVTLIKGKRVPIVRATIVKAKPGTKKLLEKARKGTIKTKELKILRKNLKKETGFKTTLSRSRRVRPRVRIPKRVPRVRVRRPPKRPPIRPPKRVPRVRVRRPPKRVPRVRPPKRPPKRVPRVRPPVKPPKRPPRKPPKILPRVRPPVPLKPIPRKVKKVRIPKKKPVIKQGFNVYGKHKKKFIKLSKVPLSKAQARDRGAFAIDKSTGVTFKLKGVGKVKKLGKLTKGEKGHFSKTRKKYRTYRIQKGRRITLKDRFIEKRGKPRIDTRGEVRDLSLAKFAKQRGFIGRKPQMPLKLKKLSRTVIKKAPKGEKPTRWRFKGKQRLGFRNNKVVEIVKFNQRKPTTSSNPMKRKRTLSFAQSQALKKGREKLARMRR